MRPHGRPQLRPDRRWYIAAYRRVVWRTLGVITLTFVCYNLLPLRSRVRFEVLARIDHPQTIPIGEFTDRARRMMESVYPFPTHSPFVSSFLEYVGNVLSTNVSVALVLTAILTVAVHVSER